jgi:hypothetical protein
MLDKLKQTEVEYRRLKEILDVTASTRKKKQIQDKLKKLSFDQDTDVMNYLLENDKNYFALTEQNIDLLINDNIEVNVTKEDWKLNSTHATALEGKIHDNGIFYGRATERNFPFLNFAGNFPKEYKGTINYIGEAMLRISKRGWQIIGGRVPKQFIGSIDKEGRMRIVTANSYWEFEGNACVGTIMADLFSGNTDKKHRFIENKDELYNMIADFRDNL